jgi:cobyric acid synthase
MPEVTLMIQKFIEDEDDLEDIINDLEERDDWSVTVEDIHYTEEEEEDEKESSIFLPGEDQ